MTTVAIVVAGGQGLRFGSKGPKALVELAGEPLVVHAVRAMWESGVVDSVVVVGPTDPADREAVASAVRSSGLVARVVGGGSSRQASVAQGLAAVDDADFVLIHDAARPLVPAEVVVRVVQALEAGNVGVVPALAVTDTIKRVASFGDIEPVADTLDRGSLRAMQTPQGFRFETIVRAHREGAALAMDEATAAPDDAALLEAVGEPVVLVRGSQRAMKITHPFDLAVATILVAQPEIG